MGSLLAQHLRRFKASLQHFTAADRENTIRSSRARNLKMEPLEQRHLLTAGALDPTFGDGGIVTTDIGFSVDDYAYDVAPLSQSDGKLLVAGETNDGMSVIRYNSDGSLDTAFGDAGVAAVSTSGAGEMTRALAMQADGKILVAGTAFDSIGRDFALARFNADGTVDTTFGESGSVTTDLGSATEEGYDVAIQNVDGEEKIVVVGRTFQDGSGFDLAVVRYDTNGTLDSTFGTEGKVVTALSSDNDSFYGVAVQGDKILVAGNTYYDPDGNFALVRYNVDGTLDASFGGDGLVTTSFGGGAEQAWDIALQGEKIVVAGATDQSGSGRDVAVARFNADGTLDTSFGGDGRVTTTVTANYDYCHTVAVYGDEIVVGGKSQNAATGGDFFAVRYNEDGSVASGFGVAGIAQVDFGSTDDNAWGIACQDDGKVVLVGGSYQDGNRYDLAIARLNADGGLDSTFGDGGKVLSDFAIVGTEDYAHDADVAPQPDGKIVVIGRSDNGAILLRYNVDGTLDTTFGLQGKLRLAFGDAEFTVQGIGVQSDGRIVTVGHAYVSGSRWDFAVMRFNTDGTLDDSFGDHGLVAIDFGGTSDYAADVTFQQVGDEEKIVVAGRSYQSGTGADFAVARLDPDGALDNTFSSDGKATTSFDSAYYEDRVWGVAAEANGRIALAGEANFSSGDMLFAVACYSLDGTPDLAFDGDGMLTTAFGDGTRLDSAQDVAFQGNKIVVAGYSDQGSPTKRDYAIARYNVDGTLDTSFGGDGTVTTDFGYSYGWDFGYNLAVSGDKIVVAGRSYQGATDFDFGIVTYDYNGSLDSDFGTDGIVTTDIGYGGHDRIETVLLQDNRMIAVGFANTGTTAGYDIAIAVYESGLGPGSISGTRFEDLNGNGIQDTGEPGIDGVVYLDANDNGVLDAASTLEPDEYTAGEILNAAIPSVTLTALNSADVPYLGGTVVAATDALASTGANTFAHSAGSAWTRAGAKLRVDFSETVSIVSLDLIAETAGAVGMIELYDADGNLLDIALTSRLPSGSAQTLRIVRPSEDIAYAIAGASGGSVHLDNLEFGAAETWVAAGPNGEYLFEDVPGGNYTVAQEVAQGWEQTTVTSEAFYYAIDRYGAELLKIDPATGNITVVGPHGAGVRLHGLVQTNSGELYAISGEGTDSFYRLDPNTGEATLIDAIGANVAWGLAYDSATDTIYTHSWGQLAVLDRTTGHVSERFGDTYSFAGVGGIAFDDAEQRVVFYDSIGSQFFAYDLEGNLSALATTDYFLCYSLTYTGDTFVMSRSWYDGDGENRSKVLLSVDPDTGTIEPLVNMSEVRIIETLEYVAEKTGAYEVYVGQRETVSQIDFGNVAVDTVPTALPDQVTLTEDDSIAIDVLANDSDADGDTLITAAVQTTSDLGVPLSINADGTVAYNVSGLFDALAAGETLTDSFRYRVGDGTGNIDAAVVTVTITGVNDAPTFGGIPDQAFDEDSQGSTIDLESYFDDAETPAQDATFEIVSAFSGVTAEIDLATHVLTVTGDADFNGAGEIVLRASDISGDGTPGLSVEYAFLVNVNPVNDAPVLGTIPDVAFDEDNSNAGIDLDVYYSDVETLADDAAFEVVSAFSGVSAAIDPVTHVLTIIGDEDFNGAGEIIVRVTDTGDGTSTALSADATIVVTVNPVNDAPVANSQVVTVTEDGVVSITLSGSDVETAEENLTFTITSLPEGGTLKDGNGNEITLDEDGGIVNGVFVGAPTLTFEPGAACDGERSTSFAFTVTDRGDPDDDPLGDMAITSIAATVAIDVIKAVEDGQVALGADGVLRIGGTSGNDVIAVAASCLCDSVLVAINDSTNWTIPLDSVNEIRVWGREGNDAVGLVGIQIMSLIHGGDGDDLLCGAAGDDLIFGGLGNDILIGAAGNDVLIGGDGVDRIIGSAGHDILVAGNVSCKYTDEALREISAEWAINLAADESEADDLLDETILDDDFDMLTGSSGSDWFIIGDGDKITDIKKAEKDGDLITEV